MFSAWRNNVHEIAGDDWRGLFILVHASVKQWVGAWRRVHMHLGFKLFC